MIAFKRSILSLHRVVVPVLIAAAIIIFNLCRFCCILCFQHGAVCTQCTHFAWHRTQAILTCFREEQRFNKIIEFWLPSRSITYDVAVSICCVGVIRYCSLLYCLQKRLMEYLRIAEWHQRRRATSPVKANSCVRRSVECCCLLPMLSLVSAAWIVPYSRCAHADAPKPVNGLVIYRW